MDIGDPFHSVPLRFGNDCRELCEGEEDTESSDDELDIILNGTPEQKRRMTRSLSRGSLQMSSSDDEFEKEMELELDATMKKHEQLFSPGSGESVHQPRASALSAEASTSGSASHHSASHQFYDEVYFDSDEDEADEKTSAREKSKPKSDGEKKENEGKEAQKGQHRIPSNDDLLYDPNIDDDNQDWMNKQRAQYYPKRKRETAQNPASTGVENGASTEDTSGGPSQASDGRKGQKGDIPKTDAILNCPACMTTLCIDCQRHDLYTNQYRAMFVMNCCIMRSEQLRYPASKKKKRKWRKRRRHEEGDQEEGGSVEGGGAIEGDELYNPVKCSICNTEVGVVDKDDIYHFFNVLTGAA